jgi:hypothetical protein
MPRCDQDGDVGYGAIQGNAARATSLQCVAHERGWDQEDHECHALQQTDRM